MKTILQFAAAIFIISIFQNINAQELVQARCITSATIALDNGEAVIYAKDFDNKSFAYDRNGLGFTFSEIIPSEDPFYDSNLKSSVMTIDAEPNTTLILDVIAWDSEYNHDKCTVEIHFVNPKTNGVVFGNVGSEEGMLIEMQKIDKFNDTLETFADSVSGNYVFTNLNSGTYKMAPYLEGDCLDGVSSLDIVIIQKHLLQLKKFKTLEQYFSADVNDDRKIDIFDILQIRRAILGLDSNFINNHAFRFIQKNASYNSFDEAFEKGLEVYMPVDGDTTQIDFKKIKIGDLNNSHRFPENDALTIKELGITVDELKLNIRNAGIEHRNIKYSENSIPKIKIHTPDIYTDTNSYINVPVVFDNIDGFAGAQFSLKWDTSKLRYNNFFHDDFDENDFDVVSNNKNGELFVLLCSLENTLKNKLSLKVNFKVVGKKGDQTKFQLQSNQGFENAFYDEKGPLKYEYESGLVIIGTGCRDEFEVELRQETGEVSIQAEDLFIGAQAEDSILINGKDSITFTCDDLGLNTILLHYGGVHGTKDCQIEVTVVDNTHPVVICKDSIEVILNEDFFYELHPDELDAGSYDICGDSIDFSLSMDDYYTDSPYVTFDCSSPKVNYITLNATNLKGKTNSCTVKVNVNYPLPTSIILTAKDTVDVVIVPGIGAKITADMILEEISPKTCPNYYSIRIYDKIPPNIFDPGNVENPVQNPGIYAVAVFSPDNNYVWTTLNVIFPDENTVKFSLPDKTADKDQEVCMGVKVTNFNNITGVNIPVSWNRDILKFSEIKNNLLQQNFNIEIEDNELLYTWNEINGRSFVDNTALFDICFDAIGNTGSKSDVLFFSPTKFERPVVTKNGVQIPNYRKKGSIKIKHYDFCSEMTVSLGVEFAEVKASDFIINNDDTEVKLINGQENKYFYCDDIGENIVELTLQNIAGEIENCFAKVNVMDKIAPEIRFDSDTIYVKENTTKPTLENLHIEVLENCSYNIFITPGVVNCGMDNPVDVTIEVRDFAGNSTSITKAVTFICTSNCAEIKQVDLDYNGYASVDARSFIPVGQGDKVVLVNDAAYIDVSCEDIGEKVVKLTKENNTGELSECYSYIEVRDDMLPVAICKQRFTVKLNDELIYELSPDEVDNGSYDNCGDLTYSIYKIGLHQNGVVFDCESDTMEVVVLKVTDATGNYNECMSQVNIQPFMENIVCKDNIQVKVFAGDSVMIVPEDILEGEGYCFDNIGLELFENADFTNLRNSNFLYSTDTSSTIFAKAINNRTKSECSTSINVGIKGDIEFSFPSVIAYPNQNICLEMKVNRFENVTSFKLPISWDKSVAKFTELKTPFYSLLENISFYYQSDSCEVIAVWNSSNSSGQNLFDNTTVFSLCFDAVGELESSTSIEFLSTSGLVTPEAKVQNHPANPDFIDGELKIQAIPYDCITELITFDLPSDSICEKTISGDSLIGFGIGNTGDSILINGKYESSLSPGMHNVLVSIYDDAGGVNRCKTTIEIVDPEPPVASIKKTGKIVLDEHLTRILNAEDFDAGSYDNCSPVILDIYPELVDCDSPNPVKVTLTARDYYGNVSIDSALYAIEYPDAPNTLICRDTVDIDVNENDVVEINAGMLLIGFHSCPDFYDVKIYDNDISTVPQNDNLIDTSDIGNIYLCKVVHPDSIHYCLSHIVVENKFLPVSCVYTPAGVPVPDVNIVGDFFSDASGCAKLVGIESGTCIKPQKESNSNGMEISDLVMLQQFLLGLVSFTPYQKIAGDLNNDGKCSTSDFLQIRKLILGNSINLPWVFVDATYDFPNGKTDNYPDSILYPSTDGKYDFIAIKRGDVDFSYGRQINHPRIDFHIKDEVLYKGQSIKISLKNSYFIKDFEGLQYSLNFNADSVKIVSIQTDPHNQYATNFYKNGNLKIVLNANFSNDLPANTEIFALELEPIENSVLHEVLTIDNEENYLANDGKTVSSQIITKWKDLIPVGSKDIIFESDIQLYPQPAKDFVYVKFKNGNYNDYKYTIIDITGQKMTSKKLINSKIDIHNLNSGLYLIKFDDNNGKSIARKLIVNR